MVSVTQCGDNLFAMRRSDAEVRALTTGNTVRLWLSLDDEEFLTATALHERLASSLKDKFSIEDVHGMLERFCSGGFVETPESNAGYDSVADRYDARPPYGPLALQRVLANTTEAHRKRVLEVGCGTGVFLEQLAPHAGEWLGALEPSHRMLDLARKRLSNCPVSLEIHRGSAELLPFSSNTVNLLILAQSLHWFDSFQFWSEAARVLHRDNRVIAFWRIPDTSSDNPIARYLKKIWPSEATNVGLRQYFGNVARTVPAGFGLIRFEREADQMTVDTPEQALAMLQAWDRPGDNPEPAVVAEAFQKVGGHVGEWPLLIPCTLIVMVLERHLESDLTYLTEGPYRADTPN